MIWTDPSKDRVVVPIPFFAVILGPTAVGKTEVSIAVALRLDAEIVSADSVQVYRGMDIGTGKPSVEARRGIPHHLIDILGIAEPFSAAKYRHLALSAIAGIAARERLPMMVGGTGLYIRAVVDGIFEGPPADPALRERLASEACSMGTAHLHEKLVRVDPVSASRIDHRNVRRVIRALEVHAATGLPISELQIQWNRDRPLDAVLIGLNRPRDRLKARIAERVNEMFEDGLVDETRRLLEEVPGRNRTALQAIGYSEAVRYLRKECTLLAAVEEVKRRTWRYAGRQMTWFSKDERIKWIMIEEGMPDEEVVARVVEIIEDRRQMTNVQ